MKTYTGAEVDAMLAITTLPNAVCQGRYLFRYINQGQLIIYTGIFEWQDGTYHDEPDPSWDADCRL